MSRVFGVHHVAIGVKDLDAMLAFYRDLMGFTEVFAEFGESEQEIMHEVTRSSRVVFYGATIRQKAGGIVLEFIRMVEPAPRPIRRDFRYGDIGVAKISIATPDVPSVWASLKDRVRFCSEPKTATLPGRRRPPVRLLPRPGGEPGGDRLGRCRGGRHVRRSMRSGLAVTDLERSVPFYRDFLGFDGQEADIRESFSGLVDEVSGTAGTRVRSCLLSASGQSNTMIELFETLNVRGRSIPFSTRWGDLGYLQAAFDCSDVNAIAADLEAAGLDLLCSPKVMQAGPDHPDPGEFVYARDPDGIPIEFLFVPE